MLTCRFCGQALPEASRFCIACGKAIRDASPPTRRVSGDEPAADMMYLPALYVMVGLLLLALLLPPWETAPGQPPELLGFHFFLDPPEPEAVVSRLLITIELVTIAIGGVYFAWLFRKK
jgi:hypothetical protein